VTNLPPISQHQIAKKLGISQATVSMALAGNPRVSAATRERIASIAAELSYHPDPGLRALGRYRRAVRPATYHATLAWIHNLGSPDWWKHSAVFRVVFDAASKRAERLGYQLENFWIDRKNISPKRATEILRAQGITAGLLLPSFDSSPPIELDWQHFTVVRIVDYLQDTPSMHYVGADHFSAMREVLSRVRAMGYRRPGFVTTRRFEHCQFAQYSSAYLSAAADSDTSPWPAIHYCDTFSPAAFRSWMRQEKPDVLVPAYITEHLTNIMETVAKMKLSVPKKLGIAMVCTPDYQFQNADLPDFSGINEGFSQMGERAVDLLVGLCENFEIGPPETPIRHLLGGTWHDGKTLRE